MRPPLLARQHPDRRLVAVRPLADESATRTGAAAYGDWRSDAPGVRRKLTAADMPAPGATPLGRATPRASSRGPTARCRRRPTGFAVSLFASGLDQPRVVRVAPNGDVFVAESAAGRVTRAHAPPTARRRPRAPRPSPPGSIARSASPSIRRAPTRTTSMSPRPTGSCASPIARGETTAAGPAEIVVPSLPAGRGHWTRDLAFSPDGKTMFVSVGSASNIAEDMPDAPAEGLAAFVGEHTRSARPGARRRIAPTCSPSIPTAASMRVVRDRHAQLLGPDGRSRRPRRCGARSTSATLLGDDLPPDYVTSVKPGAFYGWPWFYIGDHEDPRLAGAARRSRRGRDRARRAVPGPFRAARHHVL